MTFRSLCLRRRLRSDMAAQRIPPSGCSQLSDPGSNSERSADSPLPASESDSSGHVSPPNPDWTEERFRVDRKRLETLLLGRLYKKQTNKLKIASKVVFTWFSTSCDVFFFNLASNKITCKCTLNSRYCGCW